MATNKPSFLRRWFQFRLRTLLLVTVVVALLMSFVYPWGVRARRQRAAVDVILRHGGDVMYKGADMPYSAVSRNYNRFSWWQQLRHDMGLADWFSTCRTVSFYRVRFTEEEKEAVKRLPDVENLEFQEALPSTDVLETLLALPSLQGVSGWNAAWTNEQLRLLTRAKNLQHLNLCVPQLNEAGMRALGEVTSLRTLNLRKSAPPSRWLKYFRSLTDLETLYLPLVEACDEDLGHLQPLKRLRHLILESRAPIGSEGTVLTSQAFEYLALLTGLETLALRGHDFDGAGLEYLPSFQQLKMMSLNSVRLSQADLKYFAELPTLQWLDLQGSNLSDAGLLQLKEMKTLQRLDVQGTQVTEDGIDRLLEYLPRLLVNWDGGEKFRLFTPEEHRAMREKEEAAKSSQK